MKKDLQRLNCYTKGNHRDDLKKDVTINARRNDEPFRNLAKAREWFAGSLFNMAIDYWTFVACRPYGSGVTRENVLPILKELRPGFLQIYAKGETGHTSFRSSLHSEHPLLSKDLPAFYREITRETGTKLFLYWSGLEDGIAALQHPDWRLLDQKGTPVEFYSDYATDGFSFSAMCPASAYFDEWVSVQLREVVKISDPDGMWVDGTWMPPCYCPRCINRYREESGFKGDIPEEKAFQHYWAKILCEYRNKFVCFIRSIKSTILCSFGNIAVRKEFREDRDWCSGDMYSPNNHRLQQSIAMRRYNTVDLPA